VSRAQRIAAAQVHAASTRGPRCPPTLGPLATALEKNVQTSKRYGHLPTPAQWTFACTTQLRGAGALPRWKWVEPAMREIVDSRKKGGKSCMLAPRHRSQRTARMTYCEPASGRAPWPDQANCNCCLRLRRSNTFSERYRSHLPVQTVQTHHSNLPEAEFHALPSPRDAARSYRHRTLKDQTESSASAPPHLGERRPEGRAQTRSVQVDDGISRERIFHR